MNLQERQARLATTQTELSEFTEKHTANANCYIETCDAPPAVCHADLEWLSQRISWLQEDISYLRSEFWEHQVGHLPKIKGASKMNEILKTLGLDEDYEVEPQIIYASDGSYKGVRLTIEK